MSGTIDSDAKAASVRPAGRCQRRRDERKGNVRVQRSAPKPPRFGSKHPRHRYPDRESDPQVVRVEAACRVPHCFRVEDLLRRRQDRRYPRRGGPHEKGLHQGERVVVRLDELPREEREHEQLGIREDPL